MEFLYTTRFLRSLKKLPPLVADDCIHAVELFEKGERKELKFHKLHGKFKDLHSFSANFSYRIVVRVEKKVVYFMDVGSHTIYD